MLLDTVSLQSTLFPALLAFDLNGYVVQFLHYYVGRAENDHDFSPLCRFILLIMQ